MAKTKKKSPVRNIRFRMGDIAEALGTVLLQGASLVAPVPRSEDVGLDVVATLVKKLDSYKVLAENSFYVQLKSSKKRVVPFNTKASVKWLLELELPFFIGSVDISKSQIELYACHRLTQAVIEGSDLNRIILYLDSKPESGGGKKERRLNVGPPVLSWTVAEMADKDFIPSTYQILKPHLEITKRNLELGRCGRFEYPSWETGNIPGPTSPIQISGGLDDSRLRRSMKLAMPYLSACLMEFNGSGQDKLYDALSKVVDGMYALGADRDPVIDSINKVVKIRRAKKKKK